MVVVLWFTVAFMCFCHVISGFCSYWHIRRFGILVWLQHRCAFHLCHYFIYRWPNHHKKFHQCRSLHFLIVKVGYIFFCWGKRQRKKCEREKSEINVSVSSALSQKKCSEGSNWAVVFFTWFVLILFTCFTYFGIYFLGRKSIAFS